ncbi:MAG: hypothetical protein JNL32_12625 [Candidatus Kapabacteria bacterium]|nr:hypothetical protein [Candidatus Kapabacteria bacterium]
MNASDVSLRGKLSALFACIVPLCFLLSCNRVQHSPDEFTNMGEPVTGDVIFKHELSDPQGLNPYTTNDNSAKTLYTLIFDTMLEQNPITTEFEPLLCDTMPTVSDDHLRYVFRLKKNVRFSNGEPLTAADVIFSFKAIKNPLIIDASPLRNYFEDLDDVRQIDLHTVEFIMRKPYFMAMIQIGGVAIMNKRAADPKGYSDGYTVAETNDTNAVAKNTAIKQFADWFGGAEVKREPQYLIGSGPYVFEKWVTGERIILKRNKQNWNAASPSRTAYADAIVSVIITDRTSAISAMKTEDIDFFDNVPPMLYAEQVDTAKSNYIGKGKYEQSIYTYIGWNSRKPQFNDKRVRQAMAHLVNRDYMIQALMRGFAQPINGPVYRNRPEYDTTFQGYAYNPDRAKQLLAEAGWSDSNGDGVLDKTIGGQLVNMEFNMSFNAGNEIRENIAILFSGEAKKIGVKCNVQKLEWSVFLKQNSTHAFDSYIGAWVNENIPSDPYQLWHSSQAEKEGSNYVGFRNARADEIMTQNRTEFDVAKRDELMREFQRIVQVEAPYTFLWTPESLALYNKRLGNMKFYNVRPGWLMNTWFVPKRLQHLNVQ